MLKFSVNLPQDHHLWRVWSAAVAENLKDQKRRNWVIFFKIRCSWVVWIFPQVPAVKTVLSQSGLNCSVLLLLMGTCSQCTAKANVFTGGTDVTRARHLLSSPGFSFLPAPSWERFVNSNPNSWSEQEAVRAWQETRELCVTAQGGNFKKGMAAKFKITQFCSLWAESKSWLVSSH